MENIQSELQRNAQLVKGVDSAERVPAENSKPFQFTEIEKALESFKRGEFLIVLDDEGRENEGDLIIAAEAMTPEKMAFMINHTSGVICCAITEERQKALKFPIMVVDNNEKHNTAFTQSVDVTEGTTTGISASDRCKTALALVDESSNLESFNRPGHLFPLVSRKGGLMTREGHTEASTDLCRLVGFKEGGCLSEIALKNGEMAKREQLEGFSAMYGLCMITIESLIDYMKKSV